MRIIQFFDGAQSETTPTIGNISASSLVQYPSDGDYEANEQGAPAKGNIYYNETDDVIRYYNGSAWQSLIDETTEQTMIGKSMDGDLNTFTDIDLPSLKTQLADANKFIVRNNLGQVISLKAVPVGAVVGDTDTQTLSNKTIDADQNTITNIDDSNIKASAGIDASKLADGSVSNAEFQRLDGVTSPIQTQLNAKQETSEKGQPNGYASLDGGGKVPASQLPNTVMELQGFFNPNTTTLVDGVGNPGDIWEADTAGSRNFGSGSITFKIGDWAVYAADNKWHKSTNSNEVLSVAGKSGNVALVLDDNTDVILTTPSLGQTLVYNGTNWVNQTPAAGVSTLNDLSDVVISVPAPGNKLRYDGTNWVNIIDNIDSLQDVDTTSTPPTVGQTLVWNGTNWVPSTVPSPAPTISTYATNTTISSTDDIAIADMTSGNLALTLPSGTTGDVLIIKAINGTSNNKTTISGTIEGASSKIIFKDETFTLLKTSSEWKIVNTRLRQHGVATSSIKTPAGSAQQHSLANNSLSLENGVWLISGAASYSNNGSTPNYARIGIGVYAANGNDTNAFPTGLPPAGASLESGQSSFGMFTLSTGDQGHLSTGTYRLRVTSGPVTVYVVTYAEMTTPANARITAFLNATRIGD